MNHQTIMQNAEARRSVYALDRNLPLPPEEIAAIVRHALKYSPSPFNSHSVRLLVLFGAEHEKLWDIAADVLQDAAPPKIFAQQTAPKLAAFRAAAGSILFTRTRTWFQTCSSACRFTPTPSPCPLTKNSP